MSGFSDPVTDGFAITPHDSTNFDRPTRGIYVGTTGNIVVVFNSGTVTFSNVPAGVILPVRAIRVNSTNTTASDLVGLG